MPAGSGQPADGDGDLGGLLVVGVWIEPFVLVFFEDSGEGGAHFIVVENSEKEERNEEEGGNADPDGDTHHSSMNVREVTHHEGNGIENEGGSEVGLFEDEQKRDPNDRSHLQSRG